MDVVKRLSNETSDQELLGAWNDAMLDGKTLTAASIVNAAHILRDVKHRQETRVCSPAEFREYLKKQEQSNGLYRDLLDIMKSGERVELADYLHSIDAEPEE